MKKYLEYFDGVFDSTVADKRKPENKPYVAYSKTDGVVYTIIPKEDGYNLIALKKVDISNISYEEVDLGLKSGLKWANKNIGAQKIDDCGTYFSWGNTDGYTISGTKFLTVDEVCQLFSGATGETVTTKEELENILNQMGMTVDNLGIVDGYSFDEAAYSGTSGAKFTGYVLDSTHDAATANMGDSWRMPTIDEYKELVNGVKTSAEDNENPLTCTYIYLDKQGNRTEHVVYRENATDYFNVSGLFDDNDEMLFSKILGVKFTNASTDASVYFPACGEVVGSILTFIGFRGSYWSSSLNDTDEARYLGFSSDLVSADNNSIYRYYGLCVRAVK
jgi:uncharacterized protein (TIGR02145 family)